MQPSTLHNRIDRCSIDAMEQMRILSVNVGNAKSIPHRDRIFTTGIDKRSTGESIFIGANGLRGDVICDEEGHGGVDQAVYAYSAEDYAWWADELGRELEPGTFGDNLTIVEMPTDMNAGERLLIGDVVLEATAPRIPCSTLAAQMQDSEFGLAFRHAERPGIYFRVLNEGEVAAGDAVTFVENRDCNVSMLELYRFAFDINPELADLQRMLDAPIALRMRAKIQGKLDTLTAAVKNDLT